MVEGLPIVKDDHIEFVACALGKKNIKEFPNHEEKRKTELLELIHTDVCGRMQTRSMGGAWYFLIFFYDRSRFTWVYFIRRKIGVFKFFKEFKIRVEKNTTKSIKILILDQGSEFTSQAFKIYYTDNGI